MLIIDLLRHTSGLGYGWGKNTYVDRKYKRNIRGFFDKQFKAKDSKELIQAISKTHCIMNQGLAGDMEFRPMSVVFSLKN